MIHIISLNSRNKIVEEVLNATFHGIGALLAAIGIVIFVLDSSVEKNTLSLVTFGIFGISMLSVYLVSTLYHSLIFTKARKIFLRLDHSAVFILIAGTYTPFLLIIMKNNSGWILLGIVWALAVIGIILKIIFLEKYKYLTLFFYILIGWMGLIIIKPLLSALSPITFLLLVLGGICYTAGTFFNSSGKIPYNHFVWHLFVITGSFCHFIAVYSIY